MEWAWKPFPFSEEAWQDLFWPEDVGVIDAFSYEERLFRSLSEEFFLLRMDGQVWLVETYNINKVGRRIWSIHTLVPEADMGSAQWQFQPHLSSRYPAFPFTFDFENMGFSAACEKSGLLDYDGGQEGDYSLIYAPGSTLYWSPMGKESLMVHEAAVRFTVELPDGSQRYGTLYLTSEPTEGPGAIYTARLVANGLVLEQNEETGGGVIRVANC